MNLYKTPNPGSPEAPALPTSAERCPACNGLMGIVGEQAFCSRCPNIEDRPEFLQPATEEDK